jgi:hypothetical protein
VSFFQGLPGYLPFGYSAQQGGTYPQGSVQAFGIPVIDTDLINFQTWSIATRTLICTVDFVDLAGITTSITLPPNVTSSNRSGVATNTKIGGFGRVVGASCTQYVGAAPIGPGETFVALTIKRGAADYAQLFMGYYYPGHVPSFNMSGQTLEPSRSGPGRQYTAAGTAPAVATDISDTVPANAFWKLRSIEFVLTADANAANRTVNFFADDAGATKTRYLPLIDSTAQTATQVRTHGYYPGTDTDSTASVAFTDTVTVLAKYPMTLQNGVMLKPGDILRTVTTSIQAGDQYGAARYIVEEWIQTS